MQMICTIFLALIIAIIQSKWPGWFPFIVERWRTRGPRSTQARLDKITAPDYILQQRHMRDEKVIQGLVFIAVFLLLEVERFMASHPLGAHLVDKSQLVMAVIGQGIFVILALAMFLGASTYHSQTDIQRLQRERDRLTKKLESF
jgi:hypothetical protein